MTWNINWQEKLLDIYLKETKVCEVLKQGCENWKVQQEKKQGIEQVFSHVLQVWRTKKKSSKKNSPQNAV